jgi:hypothetical protein
MSTYTILSEENFQGDAGSKLTKLGGCLDNGNSDDLGLGDWTHQFEIQATNNNGETRKFTIAFQPEERNNGMKAYSGYDISAAANYGYDADESGELEVFCDYDTQILDELQNKAWKVAKSDFENLIEEFQSA